MKRKIFRAGSVAIAASVALIGGAVLSMKSATAQVPPEQTFDHLKCYPVRDGLGQQTYTADLVPQPGSIFVTDEGDPAEGGPNGCRIQAKAREFCFAVSKENARNVRNGLPPPGAAAGPAAGEFLCYRLSCPGDKVREQFNVTDQFGTRPVQLQDRPTKLCAPAFREGAPTPSPTGTPAPTATGEPTGTPEPTVTPTAEPTGEPTATPTAEPTGEPTATPTAEPTAEPTATPTAGSASRAFLDLPESLF